MAKIVARPLLSSLAAIAISSAAQGAVAPYTADTNTLALYHFDEAAGALDPGTPVANYGSNGVVLGNTGGPDGRDNVGIGGYGAAAFTGFGSSFDILNSGNGNYYSALGGNATTGGVRTTSAVAQSALQGSDGAFTYEALVKISTTAGEQTILSHDGNTDRGFMLRIDPSANLSFYNGSSSATALVPTSGTHGFVANEWFHVAVTYDGIAGAAGNLKLYWTRLDSGVTAANLLTSTSLGADLSSASSSNWLGVGTTTRGEFRFQPKGFVDEVRISSVARGADEFMFAAVPEPTSLALFGLAGVAMLRRSRK